MLAGACAYIAVLYFFMAIFGGANFVLSYFFGEIARNRNWTINHKEVSRAAAFACRQLEKSMLADRYAHESRSQDHELQPSDFSSITFTEKKNYDLSSASRLRFYPDDVHAINQADFGLVLSWYRQFKYTGKNPPLFFDPHSDIFITCFVSLSPIEAVAIAERYVGQ